ncbi:MAG: glycosyltransferase family 4 protein [Myxococcales bacterium]|nr:glycosyltransferase family 4 protein [Myxococcales bacterium]
MYGAEVWTDLTMLRRFAVRKANWVISDCHATARHLSEHGIRSSRNVVVHWDCVDTKRFFPGSGDVLLRYGVQAEPNTTTILTLARLSAEERHKGVDRLIRVMAMMSGVRVRLIVAGAGSWLEELRRQAQELGVSGRVHFIGRVAEADLVNVYRACDVFSMVTVKHAGGGEGLPLTPIEAAACGKPVLVGNADGSAEAAVDGVTGFVVDPHDLASHAARFRLLAGDSALRRRLGDSGTRRIEAEMSYEAFRNRTSHLIDSL